MHIISYATIAQSRFQMVVKSNTVSLRHKHSPETLITPNSVYTQSILHLKYCFQQNFIFKNFIFEIFIFLKFYQILFYFILFLFNLINIFFLENFVMKSVHEPGSRTMSKNRLKNNTESIRIENRPSAPSAQPVASPGRAPSASLGRAPSAQAVRPAPRGSAPRQGACHALPLACHALPRSPRAPVRLPPTRLPPAHLPPTRLARLPPARPRAPSARAPRAHTSAPAYACCTPVLPASAPTARPAPPARAPVAPSACPAPMPPVTIQFCIAIRFGLA